MQMALILQVLWVRWWTAALALVLGLLLYPNFGRGEEQVDPLSGELVVVDHDVATDAGALSLRVERWHVPSVTGGSLFGPGWRSNWDNRVERREGLRVIADRGREILFEPTGPGGEFHSTTGEKLIEDDGGRLVRLTGELEEVFDKSGRLVQQRDGNGNIVELAYDGRGRLTAITGPRHAKLTFERDPSGSVVRAVTGDGQVVRYRHEGGRLIDVQRNDGSSYHYRYGSEHRLVQVEDSWLGRRSYAYDERGRVISRTDADGLVEERRYDDSGGIVTVKSGKDGTTVFRWSADHRRLDIDTGAGHSSHLDLDAKGRVIGAVGPTALAVRFTYDENGRLAALHEPGEHVTRYTYAGDSQRIETITHSDGTLELLGYDRHGNLVAVEVGGQRVLSLEYDREGMISVIDAPGAKRSLAYDGRGRITAITDALGRTTRLEYDPRGNLVREIDPAGNVTIRAYDGHDNLVAVTEPEGGTTCISYDEDGRRIALTDANGRETLFTYDAAGRRWLEGEQASRPEAGHRLVVERPDGRTSQVLLFGPRDEPVEQSDGPGRTVRFVYDAMDRLAAEQLPTGREIRYAYDVSGALRELDDSVLGSLDLSWDQAGRLTQVRSATASIAYRYDALGRLAALVDPLGNETRFGYGPVGMLSDVTTATGARAELGYDAEGELTSVVSPGGRTTRYAYDLLGNITSIIDPGGQHTQLTYTKTGELAASTDRAGRTTRYSVEPGQRKTTLADGSELVETFDADGNPIRVNDGRFPVAWSYDTEGRATRVDYPALGKSIRHGWDELGRRSELTVSDGRKLRYRYDATSRLAAILLPDQREITFAYDAADRPVGLTWPNGVSGKIGYGVDGDPESLEYRDGSDKLLLGWRYERDSAGNPTVAARSDGDMRRYAYDEDDRLVEEWDGDTMVGYRYGPDGDRIARETASGQIGYEYEQGGELASAGGERFGHDAMGNLVRRETSKATTTYTYDALGRLAGATTPGGSVELGYAATGELVTRRTTGSDRQFVYDGLDLLEELDGEGRSLALYVHGPGLDQPLAVIRGERTFFLQADALGTVALITDAAGRIVGRQDTDAFGRPTAVEGERVAPFLFQGRLYDAALGLYYFRARWYDPALGRFLTPDPLEPALDDPGSLNRYIFARNAPTRYGDPLGLVEIDYAYYARFGLGRERANQLLTQRVSQLVDPTSGRALGPKPAFNRAIRELDAAVTRARAIPGASAERITRSVRWQLLQAHSSPNPFDYNRLLPPAVGPSPLREGLSSFRPAPSVFQQVRDYFGGIRNPFSGGSGPPPAAGPTGGSAGTQAIRAGATPGTGTQAVARPSPPPVRPTGFTRPPGVDNFGGGYAIVDGKPGPVRINSSGVPARYGPPSAASSGAKPPLTTAGGIIGMSAAAGAVNAALCAAGGGSKRECAQVFVATTATSALAGAAVRGVAAVIGGAAASTIASSAAVAAIAYQGGKAAGQRIVGTPEQRQAQLQVGRAATARGDEQLATLSELQRTIAEEARALRADLQNARSWSTELEAADPRSACSQAEAMIAALQTGATTAIGALREAQAKLQNPSEPPASTAAVTAAGDRIDVAKAAALELERTTGGAEAILAALAGERSGGGADGTQPRRQPIELLEALQKLVPALRERAQALSGRIADFRERRDTAVVTIAGIRQQLEGADAATMVRREQAIQRLEVAEADGTAREATVFVGTPSADLDRLSAIREAAAQGQGPGGQHELCAALADPTQRTAKLSPLVQSWEEIEKLGGEVTSSVDKRLSALEGLAKRLVLLREQANAKLKEAESAKARTRDDQEKRTVEAQIQTVKSILAKADTKETDGIVPETNSMSAASGALRESAKALRAGIVELRRLAGT